MSERDQVIGNFFTALKVAFKTATVYSVGHPAYRKSVEELLSKITALLEFSNPLSIGFTPNSLYLDHRFWEKEKIFVELARVFHFRKIKHLEIREGITLDELTRFVSKITLPLQEFIKEGGAQAILKTEKIKHITVEELAYSQLLRGEWDEIKDVWVYLLVEAVRQNNAEKLNQMAEVFEKTVSGLDAEDFVQNEDLQDNFYRFFKYLKESRGDKYRNSSKGFVKAVLAGKRMGPETKIGHLRRTLSEMSTEDLAATVWEEILYNDKFDSLSFSVFSRLVDRDRHAEISTSLKELFHSDNPLNRKPEVEMKLRSLLKGTSSLYISETYRQTLLSLLQEITFEKRIFFDHHLLHLNYSFALLNVLERETQKDVQTKYLERIQEEWKKISEDGDLDYLKDLLQVLIKKEKELRSEPPFQAVRKSLSESIEGRILNGEDLPDFDFFLNQLKASVLERRTYLEKIFRERIITAPLLQAYFTFFTQYLFEFNARLKEKAGDSHFLENIAASLKHIDTRISLVTLKDIFSMGDMSVKLRVLQSMQNLSVYDQKFLFRLLDSKDVYVRAGSLAILIKDEHLRQAALGRLLSIESPYGLRNRKLHRNMKLVEGMNLKDAWPYLKILSRRKHFWNKKVREASSRILEKWGEA